MRWFGVLAGVVLLVALVGGVGTMAYQAGLGAHGVAPMMQTLPPGAEGGTMMVRGMYPGYGYGWGGWHPFGFLSFIFFFLFIGLIFKLFAFGFRGGHRGGPWGGPGRWGDHAAFEEAARRRHDEWHRGQASGTGGASGTGSTEPPSGGASA